MQKITTFLTFDGRAEDAVNHYTSIFKDAKVVSRSYYGEGGPAPKGMLMSAVFELHGQTFFALNGGPTFHFAQGISLFVSCETQDEVDYFWERLSEGGKKLPCGWLEDKFGLSWQIVPTILSEVLNGKDKAGAARALKAMMGMTKLDIRALKEAYEHG